MKQIKFLSMLLMVALSLAVYACGDGEDEPDNGFKEYVGSWFCTLPNNLGTITLEIKENKTYEAIYNSGSKSETIKNTVYFSQSTNQDPNHITLEGFFYNRYNEVILDGASAYADLIAGELRVFESGFGNIDHNWKFTRIQGGGGNDAPVVTSKIVGSWESVPHDGWGGSPLFYSEFKADGTFTDYLVENGEKYERLSGKYQFKDNILTYLDESNMVNCFNNDYTVTFSSDGNTMTLTNDLLRPFNPSGKIIMKRVK